MLGQFRDLDDPDRFVWLGGFSDMESRRRSVEAFYGVRCGPRIGTRRTTR